MSGNAGWIRGTSTPFPTPEQLVVAQGQALQPIIKALRDLILFEMLGPKASQTWQISLGRFMRDQEIDYDVLRAAVITVAEELRRSHWACRLHSEQRDGVWIDVSPLTVKSTEH